MQFEFRAHRPTAYFRFAIILLLLIGVNILLIGIFFPSLKAMNEAAEKSIILIIPWLFLLLLPSALLGMLIYRSFVNSYRFTIDDAVLAIELLKRNKVTAWRKEILWKDLINAHIVDFEDNHYCNLEFSEKKNNLVIHRESGEFEKFYGVLASRIENTTHLF